jgi:hypothetical protein
VRRVAPAKTRAQRGLIGRTPLAAAVDGRRTSAQSGRSAVAVAEPVDDVRAQILGQRLEGRQGPDNDPVPRAGRSPGCAVRHVGDDGCNGVRKLDLEDARGEAPADDLASSARAPTRVRRPATRVDARVFAGATWTRKDQPCSSTT